MKTTTILLIAVALSTTLHCCTMHAAESNITGSEEERLEILFRLQRGGIASSQYAVWIEDASGKNIRTLYVTSFTAKGGYEYRKDAIPQWVGKAQPQHMTSAQIDAITGATPHDGLLIYKWDGTDDNGNQVPPGIYRLFIEGTLYWESRVVYSGELEWGGKEQASIPITIRLYNRKNINENMITDLKARYISKRHQSKK